jgi:hypothetical protein
MAKGIRAVSVSRVWKDVTPFEALEPLRKPRTETAE